MSQKISVYSISELKNTTDDALTPYLVNKQKFTQNHYLTDVRLGLGYTAVAIAAVLFYFDWKSTWAETKGWTLYAVIAYSILNGALTLWMWGVEKGKIFNGSKGSVVVSFASRVNKYEPIYRLKVRYSDPKESTAYDWKELEIQSPFTQWFTADGHFMHAEFQKWLTTSVPFLQKV